MLEVDGSDTLAQVKGKLLAELGVPRARHVRVRMRGGGDIGDDLRICDTEMDEGCAVELYCTGANITPGLLTRLSDTYSLTLSPCDRYLAEMRGANRVVLFDTRKHMNVCVVSLPRRVLLQHSHRAVSGSHLSTRTVSVPKFIT